MAPVCGGRVDRHVDLPDTAAVSDAKEEEGQMTARFEDACEVGNLLTAALVVAGVPDTAIVALRLKLLTSFLEIGAHDINPEVKDLLGKFQHIMRSEQL